MKAIFVTIIALLAASGEAAATMRGAAAKVKTVAARLPADKAAKIADLEATIRGLETSNNVLNKHIENLERLQQEAIIAPAPAPTLPPSQQAIIAAALAGDTEIVETPPHVAKIVEDFQAAVEEPPAVTRPKRAQKIRTRQRWQRAATKPKRAQKMQARPRSQRAIPGPNPARRIQARPRPQRAATGPKRAQRVLAHPSVQKTERQRWNLANRVAAAAAKAVAAAAAKNKPAIEIAKDVAKAAVKAGASPQMAKAVMQSAVRRMKGFHSRARMSSLETAATLLHDSKNPEEIHKHAVAAQQSAEEAKGSLKEAKTAFEKTRTNVKDILKTGKKIEGAADDIQYLYAPPKKIEKERENAKSGARPISCSMLLAVLLGVIVRRL